MPAIQDVRETLYAALKSWVMGRAEDFQLIPKHKRIRFELNDIQIEFDLLTSQPEKQFAGTGYLSAERGIFQVSVYGSENRGQKFYEALAWDFRESVWPGDTKFAPTLGADPIVRLGPEPPYVRDNPAPLPGKLGTIVDVYWNTRFKRA